MSKIREFEKNMVQIIHKSGNLNKKVQMDGNQGI